MVAVASLNVGLTTQVGGWVTGILLTRIYGCTVWHTTTQTVRKNVRHRGRCDVLVCPIPNLRHVVGRGTEAVQLHELRLLVHVVIFDVQEIEGVCGMVRNVRLAQKFGASFGAGAGAWALFTL